MAEYPEHIKEARLLTREGSDRLGFSRGVEIGRDMAEDLFAVGEVAKASSH